MKPVKSFQPGRLYRNTKMHRVDFLVTKVEEKGGLPWLTGHWILRTNKGMANKGEDTVRVNFQEDWVEITRQ